MKAMRAWVIVDPGPEGRLEERELPVPVAEYSDVVVKVAAVGVANVDIMAREGRLGLNPTIPGVDVAGTVVELGKGVSRLRVGDRVVLNPAVTCDRCRHCATGDHGTCRNRRALGQGLDGGYAQFVCIPAANAHRITSVLPFEQAAAIPSNFFTAWQMLFARAKARPGDTVLVVGAAGGVGCALVKIAKLSGMRVVGAVGSMVKAVAAREFGADLVVDYSIGPIAAEVQAFTGGEGVDAVLDTVGADLWPALLPTLRASGRLVTCSAVHGSSASVPMIDLLSRQLSIIGAGGSGSKAIAAKVVELFNQGQLRAHVSHIFPLDQVEEAHRLLRTRKAIGKLVLRA